MYTVLVGKDLSCEAKAITDIMAILAPDNTYWRDLGGNNRANKLRESIERLMNYKVEWAVQFWDRKIPRAHVRYIASDVPHILKDNFINNWRPTVEFEIVMVDGINITITENDVNINNENNINIDQTKKDSNLIEYNSDATILENIAAYEKMYKIWDSYNKILATYPDKIKQLYI